MRNVLCVIFLGLLMFSITGCQNKTDPDHPVNYGNQQYEPGALTTYHPAKTKDDCSFILLDHLDCHEQEYCNQDNYSSEA